MGIALLFFILVLANTIFANIIAEELQYLLFILGIILIVAYFFLRKATLTFITEQEKIPFNFKGKYTLEMVTTISKIVRRYE